MNLHVKSHGPVNTLEKLGEIAKASSQTVYRVKYILDNGDDDVKNKLRMGYPGMSINNSYVELLNKGAKPRETSKVKLDTDENTEKLRSIFDDKLEVILEELDKFEKSLENEKARKKVNSLTMLLKKVADKI